MTTNPVAIGILLALALLFGVVIGMATELWHRVRHLERDATAMSATFGIQTKTVYELRQEVRQLQRRTAALVDAVGELDAERPAPRKEVA